MLIYLADQADLSAAAAIPDWNLRGAAVVETLLQQATATQAPLLAELRQAGYAPRSFWIVNALEVTGGQALAQQLAGQPGVALVAANGQHTLAMDSARASPDGVEQPAWGLQRIRVPSVWADWGARGAGITVANLDTGVAYTHTALLHQYRGWTPTSVSHNYNWYDTASDKPLLAPADPVGHGTHTMGIMVGGAAGGYSGLGVAPDARWIAVRGCDGIFCADSALIAGAQWLLAPTNLAGKNPRTDLRPQIINNSWGQAGDSQWYTGYVTAWNAAGIFSAFANGNDGQFAGCQNTLTPGNYSQGFAVGATDDADDAAVFFVAWAHQRWADQARCQRAGRGHPFNLAGWRRHAAQRHLDGHTACGGRGGAVVVGQPNAHRRFGRHRARHHQHRPAPANHGMRHARDDLAQQCLWLGPPGCPRGRAAGARGRALAVTAGFH